MRILLPAALVACGFALAGCGGSSHRPAVTSTPATMTQTAPTASVVPTLTTPEARQYDKAMLSLGAKLGRAVDGIYPLDTGTPGSSQAKHTIAKLERARSAVSSIEASLGRVQPPAAVAAEQQTLRKDLRAVARQISQLATSLRTGDSKTFDALSQLPALARVAADTDAIRKKGYDVLGRNG
jgi:hypothetical protein